MAAGVPGFDPNRLFTQLLNTGLAEKDNRLYQLIYLLIQQLVKVTGITNTIPSGGGGSSVINNFETIQQLFFNNSNIGFQPLQGIMFPPGGFSSGNSSSSVDHVVASDGGIPTPQPVNDGAGSFIYVPYIP